MFLDWIHPADMSFLKCSFDLKRPQTICSWPRAALLLCALCLVASSSQAQRPNVLILLADDLGYQDVGCYRGPVKTPNIDSLAAAGTRFETFYSGCAVCSPSRATLLTGRHHIRAGVFSWIHDASQRSHLLKREQTIAEVLKQAGYATAHIGKWHLGLPSNAFPDKPTPDQHGFDHWMATWNNASPSHANPDNFIRNGNPIGKQQGYSCQIVADEAIRWLEQRDQADQPFFLNVWFHEPHAPIAAPAQIVGEYGAQKDPAAVYSATIDNTDRAIGRLLAHLQKTGQRDKTLIIYASDNGSYRDDRTGGLRGRKGVNWEGGIRVPGIFCWPGKIPAGAVQQVPAGLVDVLPTICGLLNLQRDASIHLDGSDLSPLLLEAQQQAGAASKWRRQQPLFWHLQRSKPIVAMREGDYSLVAFRDYELPHQNMFKEQWIPAVMKGRYTGYQLFDLKSDPQQTTDLAQQRPEVLERLKAKLLEINDSIMSEATDWSEAP